MGNCMFDTLSSFDPGASMDVDDYINALHQDGSAGIIPKLFNALLTPIDIYNRNFGIGVSPILRIVNHPVPQAEGIEGIIRVTHGMIRHCATVVIMSEGQVASSGDAIVNIYDNQPFIRHMMLVWVLLHEHMHVTRKHAEALADLGADPMTEQAIEYDADMCALGAAYRYAQSFTAGHLDDLTVRRLILFSVYWLLRTLTTFCRRSTHAPIPYRILLATSKLAMLHERPTPDLLPDVGFEGTETRERHAALLEVVINAERAFVSLPGYVEEFGSLKEILLPALDSGEYLAATRRWNEIRLQVAELIGPAELELERAVAAK